MQFAPGTGTQQASQVRNLRQQNVFGANLSKNGAKGIRQVVAQDSSSVQASDNRIQLRNQLLKYIEPLNRGLDATDEQKAEVERMCKELEAMNPNEKSLGAPEINAKWRLLYTTSSSILGTNRPAFLRPFGTIYQIIDTGNLAAKNQETTPFFNSVTAKLEPVSDSKTNVIFQTFKILGLIPFQAPPTARGWIDITYLDDVIRVTRGDKGNLFLLDVVERDVKVEA